MPSASSLSGHKARAATSPLPDHRTMLAATGLTAGYDRSRAVIHEVSLEASVGEVVALIGPNGSGKSTLLKTVAGLTRVQAGSVKYGDRDITELAPHARPSCGIGYVPQEGAVFPSLTVRENLLVGGVAIRKSQLAERIGSVLDAIPGLKAALGQKAGNLSGGQQRLVAVGRALISQPTMLLLDEPTAGLAPQAAASILAEVSDLRKVQGIGLFIVEQNVRYAMDISDRIYVLAAGEIAFEGSREDVMADEELSRLYLGASR